ncbi:MAG: response regulator [Chloroflexi bacterium]|nr:response regulator [Chloroflexota bacterium]
MSEAKSRLLIVEDDMDLSEMLNAYFRVQGYEVSTASWGEEAVRISKDIDPDLVVLDIRLPDIDGYEVCRRIRTNRRTQNIPIIFLTEKRDRVDKLAGLELGVVDYITKPFDIQELRLRVRNALRTASQQPLINPITNLSEGDLVNENLEQLIFADPDWAILSLKIRGLDEFREKYGFVASDDVLRAVALMVNNAVREVGTESDFVGHTDANDFVIITDLDKAHDLKERIQVRLQQSMEYFYPLKDREQARAAGEGTLQLVLGQVLASDGPFDDIDALMEAIAKSIEDGLVQS